MTMLIAGALLSVIGVRVAIDLVAHISRFRSFRRRYPGSGLSFGTVWRAVR